MKIANVVVDDERLIDMNSMKIIEAAASSRHERLKRSSGLGLQAQNGVGVSLAVIIGQSTP